MFLLSIRRRKKEIRYVSVVTFIAVFFLAGIMLLQDIMNRFVMEQSHQNYGGWTISAVDEQLSHPYFAEEGKCETLTRLNAEKLFQYYDAYVGTVDDVLLEMGNIRLYEGRMPEKANEIVADMPSLSAMGCSYDVGQEITLYWQVQGEKDGKKGAVLVKKTYELVGIMHSFAAAWQSVEQKVLPGVLVMEGEAKYFPKLHTTWFYSLKKQYQGIDAVEFYEGIKVNCEKPKNVVYNSYAHTEQLWGTGESFRYVEYVMIIIAVSAMGFLLASYTAKRRKVYYQYRCMGASIWQVRQMILVECLYATLPAIGLGIALAYLIAFIGCKAAAWTMQMSDFFAFDAGVFGRQLSAIGIVLLCSVGWNALQIRDKRLVQQNQEVPVKKLNRLRKRAVKTKHPQKDFLNRYNKLHPFSRIMFILFSVLVTGVLVLCGNQLNHNLTYRYDEYQEMIDFTLEAKDGFKLAKFPNDGDDNVLFMTGKTFRFKEGLFPNDVTELENIWGVGLKKKILRDNLLCLQWEEKQESAYIQYVNREYRTWGNEYDYGFHVRFLEDREELETELPYFAESSEVDWDAWESGEEIFLVWCNFTDGLEQAVHMGDNVWLKPGDGANFADQTVQPGEQMQIGWMELSYYLPVTVGDVYNIAHEKMSHIFGDRYEYTMINIVASRQLAVRLAEMYANLPETELYLSGIGSFYEGQLAEMNEVWGQFDENASFESTDKQISRIAWKNGWILETDAEARRVFYQSIVQEVSIFGSLFLLILAVFLILQKNLADSQNHYRKEQYRLLKKIGMEEKTYLRRTMVSAVKDYVWIFCGVIVGYLLYGIFMFRQYTEELALDDTGRLYCQFVDDWTSDAKLLTLDHLIYQVEHLWTIVIVVVIFGLLMGNRFLQTKRYMKKEEV